MKRSGEISGLTLIDYMQLLSGQNRSSHSPFDLNRYLQTQANAANIFTEGPVGFFVLDYRIQGYYHVGKNVERILGIPSEAFMEGGIPFFHEQMVKEDLEIVSRVAFPYRLTQILSVTNELDRYWYSINYRLQRPNGQIVHVLQQFNIPEVDEQGYPLMLFGYCTDISDFKQDNKIVDAIYRRDSQPGLACVCKNIYFPGSEDPKLSSRETEILKWILHGLSSKGIADKLYLSTHTVNTHRRNMLGKTNAKNTADLLKFAYEHGWV